ncbi:MAG: putative oxidoreductase YcjS [Planctomycetota bacterium]|jgi:predicted dehydrogenase
MADATIAVLTDSTAAHLEAYLAGLRDSPEVAGVVVADPSGESEVTARKILGERLVGFERQHAKVLEQVRPAMALVTLEASRSPPLIEMALEANCHVLAEKPSCVRIADFRALARLADMKHRHLMLALANRLLPTMQLAREMITRGDFGKLYGCELHIVADQTRLKNPSYHQSWYADRERSGGGHLMWLGIHWVDLVMYLTGQSIVEVCGFTGIVGGQSLKIEDSAAMAVCFENGMFGTVTSGYYLDKGYHSHIKIWGADGWLQLDPHGGEALQWYRGGRPDARVERYEGPAVAGNYTPLVQAAIRASLDRLMPPISTAESLRALETIFACYRASQGRRVERVSG